MVPLNVLLKGREVAYHLDDSDAKAYLCFQGTPELPMAQDGYAGFEQTEGCETFVVITADPAAASPIDGRDATGNSTITPQLTSMSSRMRAYIFELVASLMEGAGFDPKQDPRPVVKATRFAPLAIWPVAPIGS